MIKTFPSLSGYNFILAIHQYPYFLQAQLTGYCLIELTFGSVNKKLNTQ